MMGMYGEYTPYDEYHDRVTGDNIDMRPTEVIMAELDELENKLKGDNSVT